MAPAGHGSAGEPAPGSRPSCWRSRRSVRLPRRGHGRRGACPSTSSGVTVVVDFGAFGAGTVVRCAPGDPATGFAALTGAGFSLEQVTNVPGFLCRIDGRPGAGKESCVNTPPASAYWVYWHAPRGGSWTYSSSGAATRNPAPGTVEGWSFAGPGGVSPPGVPPPPPPAAPKPTATPRPPTPAPAPTAPDAPDPTSRPAPTAAPTPRAVTPAPTNSPDASARPSDTPSSRPTASAADPSGTVRASPSPSPDAVAASASAASRSARDPARHRRWPDARRGGRRDGRDHRPAPRRGGGRRAVR